VKPASNLNRRAGSFSSVGLAKLESVNPSRDADPWPSPTVRVHLPAAIREVRSGLPRVVLLSVTITVLAIDAREGEQVSDRNCLRTGCRAQGGTQSPRCTEMRLGKPSLAPAGRGCVARDRPGTGQSGIRFTTARAVLRRTRFRDKARSFSSRMPIRCRKYAGDRREGKVSAVRAGLKRSIV
jgi:hypothetical protein